MERSGLERVPVIRWQAVSETQASTCANTVKKVDVTPALSGQLPPEKPARKARTAQKCEAVTEASTNAVKAGFPVRMFRLSKLIHEKGPLGGSEQLYLAGKYRHPETKQCWYVKCPPKPEAARNEILMAKLAKLMGLNVPACWLHEENGVLCIVFDWWELKPDPDALSRTDNKAKALLFLVASVLGNGDIGGFWGNTMVDLEGRIVALDWGEAGLYGPPFGSDRKRHGHFTSTPLELSFFMEPDSELAASYIGAMGGAYNSAKDVSKLFQTLSYDEISSMADKLLNLNTKEMDELIDLYGPSKATERQWFKSDNS